MAYPSRGLAGPSSGSSACTSSRYLRLRDSLELKRALIKPERPNYTHPGAAPPPPAFARIASDAVLHLSGLDSEQAPFVPALGAISSQKGPCLSMNHLLRPAQGPSHLLLARPTPGVVWPVPLLGHPPACPARVFRPNGAMMPVQQVG